MKHSSFMNYDFQYDPCLLLQIFIKKINYHQENPKEIYWICRVGNLPGIIFKFTLEDLVTYGTNLPNECFEYFTHCFHICLHKLNGLATSIMEDIELILGLLKNLREKNLEDALTSILKYWELGKANITERENEIIALLKEIRARNEIPPGVESVFVKFYRQFDHSFKQDLLSRLHSSTSCPSFTSSSSFLLASRVNESRRSTFIDGRKLKDILKISSVNSYSLVERTQQLQYSRNTTQVSQFDAHQISFQSLKKSYKSNSTNKNLNNQRMQLPVTPDKGGSSFLFLSTTFRSVMNCYQAVLSDQPILAKDKDIELLNLFLNRGQKPFYVKNFDNCQVFMIDRVISKYYHLISSKSQLSTGCIERLLDCAKSPSDLKQLIFGTTNETEIAESFNIRDIRYDGYKNEPELPRRIAQDIKKYCWENNSFQTSPISDIINTELEAMRVEAITSIFNTLSQNSQLFTGDHIALFHRFLGDSNRAIQKVSRKILLILTCDDKNIDHQVLFESYLTRLNEISLQNTGNSFQEEVGDAIKFFMRQVIDPKKRNALFTPKVVENLIYFTTNSNFNESTKLDFIEIISDFLVHQSTNYSFTEEQIKHLSFHFDGDIALKSQELIVNILKLVLVYTEDGSQPSSSLLEVFQTIMKGIDLDRIYHCLILCIFSQLKDKTVIDLNSFLWKLGDHARFRIVEGQIEMVLSSNENASTLTISQITAKLVLEIIQQTISGNEFQQQRISLEVSKPFLTKTSLEHIIKSVVSTEGNDDLRRSISAKCLFLFANERLAEYCELIDDLTLLSVVHCFADSIPEISVYSRMFYIYYMNYVASSNLNRLLESLCEAYIEERIKILDQKHFAPEINEGILRILANYASKHQIIPERCLLLFTTVQIDIFNAEEDKLWLEILTSCMKNGQQLPQEVIRTLEQYLQHQVYGKKSLNIIIGIVKNLQNVSIKSLQVFRQTLLEDVDEELRNHVYQCLEILVVKVYMLNEFFVLCEAERCARYLKIHPAHSVCWWTLQKLSSDCRIPITISLWNLFMDLNLNANNNILSIIKSHINNNFPILEKFRNWLNSQFEDLLDSFIERSSIFETVSIPLEIIEIIHDFEKNYRSLQPSVISYLENALMIISDNLLDRMEGCLLKTNPISQSIIDVLSIFLCRFESGDKLSIPVIKAIIRVLKDLKYKYQIDDLDFKQRGISLLSSILSSENRYSDLYSDMIESMKSEIESIFVQYIHEQEQTLVVEEAIQGVSNYIIRFPLLNESKDQLFAAISSSLNDSIQGKIANLLNHIPLSPFQIQALKVSQLGTLSDEKYLQEIGNCFEQREDISQESFQIQLKRIQEILLKKPCLQSDALSTLLKIEDPLRLSHVPFEIITIIEIFQAETLRHEVKLLASQFLEKVKDRSSSELMQQVRTNPKAKHLFMIKKGYFHLLLSESELNNIKQAVFADTGIKIEDPETLFAIRVAKVLYFSDKSQVLKDWIKFIISASLSSRWGLCPCDQYNLVLQWNEKVEPYFSSQCNKMFILLHEMDYPLTYAEFCEVMNYLHCFPYEILLNYLTIPSLTFTNLRTLWIRQLLLIKMKSIDPSILSVVANKICEKEKKGRSEVLLKNVKVIDDIEDVYSMMELINNHNEILCLTYLRQTHSLKDLCDEIKVETLLSTIVKSSSNFEISQPKKTEAIQLFKRLILGTNCWNFDSMLDLMNSIPLLKCSPSLKLQATTDLFRLVLNYSLAAVNYLPRIQLILKESAPKDWINNVNDMMIKRKFKMNVSFKNSTQIVNDFCRENNLQNENCKSYLCDALAEIFKSSNTISNWRAAEIMEWCQNIQTNRTNYFNRSRITKTMAVLNQANYVLTGLKMTMTQILTCVVAFSSQGNDCSILFSKDQSKLTHQTNSEKKGILLQVLTGEGKTLIISMIAIVKALQGHDVDIITSSPVEAERCCNEQANLYRMFGISVSNNVDHSIYTSGPKRCYKSKVVYGEIAQFQFDYLRAHFSALNTKSSRKCDFFIGDEIDSILIDDSAKIAKLSSPVAGMDQFQPILLLLSVEFLTLLTKIHQINGVYYLFYGKLEYNDTLKTTSLYFMNSQTKECRRIMDLKDYLMKHPNSLDILGQRIDGDVGHFIISKLDCYLETMVKEKKLIIPFMHQDHYKNQKSKWITNTIIAHLELHPNAQYIIQDNTIKPIAYDSNGVILNSTQLGQCIQQLIQIKHQLPITSESLTTNFISTMAYVKLYKHNVCGLTGTLGPISVREHLETLYSLNCLEIPSSRPKQFQRFTTLLHSTRLEWLESMNNEIEHEVRKGRGILIICKLIEEVQEIESFLRAKKNSTIASIKTYTMNGMNQEKEIQKINSCEVIISTLLGGRGMDIKADDINSVGGMHVIVTFLPDQRNEDQALYRTSRQGKLGSGRMILNKSSLIAEGYSDDDFRDIAAAQNRKESEKYHTLFGEQLKVIELKDELFESFSSLVRGIREDIRAKEKKSKVWTREIWEYFNEHSPISNTENITVNAIEEKWIKFLSQNIDNLTNDMVLNSRETIKSNFQQFIEMVKEDYKKEKLITNPLHHIQLAEDLTYTKASLDAKTAQQAMKHYDAAIGIDADSSAAAYVGKAVIYLKTRDCFFSETNKIAREINQYKTLARENLCLAKDLLREEMAYQMSIYSLVKESTQFDADSALMKQLETRLNILGNYLQHIEQNELEIAKSQRLITLIQSHDRVLATPLNSADYSFEINKQEFLKRQLNGSISNPFDEFHQRNSLYTIQFNDLTAVYDSGTIDQACNTIDNIFDFESIETSIILPEIDILSLQSTLLNPTLYFQCQTKIQAFSIVENQSTWFNFFTNTTKLNICVKNAFNDNQSIIQRYQSSIQDAKDLFQPNNNLDNSNEKENSDLDDVKSHHITLDFYNTPNPMQNYDILYSNVKGSWEELSSHHYSTESTRFQLPCDSIDLELSGKNEDILTLINQHSELFEEFLLLEINKSDGKKFKHVGYSEKKLSQLISKLTSLPSEHSSAFFLKKVDAKTILHNEFITSHFSCQAIKYCQVKLKQSISFPHGMVNIHYSLAGKSKKEAKSFIEYLRSQNTVSSFILEFSKLSLDQVNSIVKNADLTEEQMSISSCKALNELYSQQIDIQSELFLFTQKGYSYLLQFNERSVLPWKSILFMGVIAGIQVGAGVALIPTGYGAQVGMSLITEGFSDSVMIAKTGFSRRFSWSEYCQQKAVSLVISATTLGLQSLKDGAKGAANLANGVKQELLETAGTMVVMNGQAIGQTLKESTVRLQSLAFQYLAVTAAETAGREVLNYAIDNVVSFGFQHYHHEIERHILSIVNARFGQTTNLQTLIDQLLTLDKLRGNNNFQNFISSSIQELLNGNNSSQFEQYWNSIGLPLCRGILSAPQYLGSQFSTGLRIIGILNGLSELTSIIDEFHHQFYHRLATVTQQHLSLVNLYKEFCQLNEKEFQSISNSLKENKDSLFAAVQNWKIKNGNNHNKRTTAAKQQQQQQQSPASLPSLDERINGFYQNFEHHYTKINHQTIVIQISQLLTQKIIHISESQLIAPISTALVASGVNSLSTYFQNCAIRKELSQSSEENKIELLILNMKGMIELLTPEEQNRITFLQNQQSEITALLQNEKESYKYSSMITMQANKHMVTYNQCSIAYHMKQIPKNSSTSLERFNQLSDKMNAIDDEEALIDDYANEIINEQKPAGFMEMMAMAAINDLDIRIVEPNYHQTPDDADKHIVVFIKGEKNEEGVFQEGHWCLMDKSTSKLINVPTPFGSSDCGYGVISMLTGNTKTITQLRQQTAEFIRNEDNQKHFSAAIQASNWITNRFPAQANYYNMVGTEDFFASHKHGVKDSNHQLVHELAQEFQKLGMSVWIDCENINYNIDQQIVDGLNRCENILIFLTNDYYDDVLDNKKCPYNYCRKEFYATHSSTSTKRNIYVILEDRIKERLMSEQKDVVNLHFTCGSPFFHDLSHLTPGTPECRLAILKISEACGLTTNPSPEAIAKLRDGYHCNGSFKDSHNHLEPVYIPHYDIPNHNHIDFTNNSMPSDGATTDIRSFITMTEDLMHLYKPIAI